MSGVLLLSIQALIYFGVMTALLAARKSYGVGLFVCALGVMHFLETYLAAVFFIELPFGLLSPGSTVLFSGKLMMFLLLYIREDAEVVRQPIYGLLIGNILLVVLALVLRFQTAVKMPGYAPDLAFLDQIGILMVWGTLLLFVDCIALIMLYERMARLLKRNVLASAFVASAVVLTFDQLMFYPVLNWVTGTPFSALLGGWVAKMGAAAVYSALVALYLSFGEPAPSKRRSLADIFQALTYRNRYEDLLARSLVDEVTGVKNRAAFEQTCREWLERKSPDGRPITVAMADVDRFKAINDQYGHAAGDAVLRAVGLTLARHVRDGDTVFRYGGEEFAILLRGLDHPEALEIADRLRVAVATEVQPLDGRPVTVSVGVASSAYGAGDLRGLLDKADKRLYDAKRLGRNRVVGETAPA
ncbi:GGDEF domain-containing protein [Chelatococcus sambhunathii]|uniref:diguanylate cyclase n=1 Tax=Chelatococcus sambhunathii TaxID=363953 RepID=A0ABU1DCH8_9HYPH|nr:GGDEF domain-containing protein [Chelatococcus sambhunathii]MDR4305777.1 GGDEF domain-containing protein [Chelatococcus sambhunathii]